jgi:hypothetical protein
MRGPNDLAGDAEESGFAGTVAAGEHGAFARSDFEGNAAKGEKAAVAFVNVLEAETGWRYVERSHGSFVGAFNGNACQI